MTAQQVRAITVPKLITATNQDIFRPTQAAHALHALLPHAGLAQITPKGQNRQNDVSEFRAALAQFFEELG